MKIGILTLPLNSGYGGILQAFALQKTLKKMGHDTWLINRQLKRYPRWKYLMFITYRILKKILGKETIVFKEKLHRIACSYTAPFINQHIQPQTNKVRNLRSFKKCIEKHQFEAIIVGSDQVWRPQYSPNIYEAYLSNICNDKILRISYAASFGTDKWEYTKKQTIYCKNLINKFSSISVREDSAVELCRKYFDIKGTQVLDPTLLLDQTDYLSAIGRKDLSRTNNSTLFVYILDQTKEKQKVINKVAKEIGLNPSYIKTSTNNNSIPLEFRLKSGVEEWLLEIYNSKFIITDSFHGTVFSIIFNKPFIVIANNSRGLTRFTSILKLFNLESRLITSFSDLDDELIQSNIDYEKVNQIKNKLKYDSILFLENALN